MDEAPIEVVEAVVWLKTDGLFELCECVVDLVEHHHAVTSIGVVLGVLVIEANSRAKVIHCLLVVSGGHEGVATVSVVLGMGGALVVGRCGLKACDGLAKLLDGSLSVCFILLLVILLQVVLALIVEFKRQALLVDLITMVCFFGLLAFGFLGFVILH